MSKEFCNTCIEKAEPCLFKQAVEVLKPGELTETRTAEYREFAKNLGCKKIDEVNSIINRLQGPK